MHTTIAGLASLVALAASPLTLAAPGISVAPGRAPVDLKIAVRAALRGPALGIDSAALHVPLLVEHDHEPTAADLDALRTRGATILLREDGSPVIRVRNVAVDAPAGAADAIAALPGVRRVTLDGGVLPHPRPLDVTTEIMNGAATHRLRNSAGLDLTGKGMSVCDVDSGVDVFHPLFFRADGGYFDWVDADGDGAFTPGVDQVDLGAGPVVVEFTDAVKADYYSGEPVSGDDGIYQLTDDFLYADENGNGTRDFGKDAGFTSMSPSLGERWLLPDDVNDNGKLDVGERLVALGTSKIAAFRINQGVFRRGANLIDAPYDASMEHGTGATGVMVAGVPGMTKLVGVAPDADMFMATDLQGGREFEMTDWCIQEGARVVLHEYAPWVGYHLDGSSPMEALIDETSAQGVSHINPAGNLSTAKKLAKLTVPSGETTEVPIVVPDSGIQLMFLTFLWRTPSRDLEFELVSPSGETSAVFTQSAAYTAADFGEDFKLRNQRIDSSRGTAMTAGSLTRNSGSGPIETGEYTLRITDPAAAGDDDVEVLLYVLDEVSGWGLGIHFPEHSSEDHLVGYPATADHGMGIAAFVGRGEEAYWGEPGERAGYSGRGHRIDGERDLWISAPADPWTTAHFDDLPVSYILYGGTSGASPHVAGTAALLLENEPELTGDDVRSRIADSAVVDAFTGTVPNDDWGYGKLDAYRAVTGEAPPDGTAPTVAAGTFEVIAGVETPVTLALADPDQDVALLEVSIDLDYDGIYDIEGVGPTANVRIDAVGDQLAKVRVRDATGRTGQALVSLRAGPDASSSTGAGAGAGAGAGGSDAPAAAAGAGGSDGSSGNDAEDGDDEGCDCRAAGSGPSGSPALVLALAGLGAVVTRRRRRR